MMENEERSNLEEAPHDDAVTGKSPKRWLIPTVAAGLLVVAIIGLLAWRMTRGPAERPPAEVEKNEAGTVKFLMEQQWLVKMKLAQAEEQTVARQITAVGRVVPAANSQAVVSTPVAGILSDRQLPTIGQYIARGQSIAVVRQTATSAERAQTQAAISQAETQRLQVQAENSRIGVENARLESEKRAASGEVESSRVRLEAARREADRMQRLFDGKAASEKQLAAARSEVASAQSNYDSAIRQRDALLAARSVRAVNIPPASTAGPDGSLTISAPFGGYVTKVNKSIGEQVSPGDAIIEISNLDTVYVEAPIFERDLNVFGGGKTATFTTSAYPQEFKGSIIDIGASINEQTRAANVVFIVENAGRALRLGMQANVKLDAEQTVTAMMVPKEAVIESEGKQYVYVLLSGEEFQRREVTIGDEYGEKVAILTGVEKGERVVTQGAYQLRLQELRPADTGVHSHET